MGIFESRLWCEFEHGLDPGSVRSVIFGKIGISISIVIPVHRRNVPAAVFPLYLSCDERKSAVPKSCFVNLEQLISREL
jgi:hypothetical protein